MKWILADPDPGIISDLSGEGGYHPVIARLMAVRGIADCDTARLYVSCDVSALSRPDIFSGMDRVSARIRQAVNDSEKIAVYGDYDVDGVTGSALLYLVLRDLGAAVVSHIPDRMSEGYGLHSRSLDELKESGVSLVITVDCGITAREEARHARELGIDLIITDHHEFAKGDSAEHQLPDAYAVLHPALIEDGTPERVKNEVGVLTGVGIAFKLAQALLEKVSREEAITGYLDLVALGTVADVGMLRGENRILVKHGLEALSRPNGLQRHGITALKQVAGLDAKKIGVGTVGFSLAPRINASGRLERADAAFQLLTADSLGEAHRIAEALDRVNKERQAVEESIKEESRRLCRDMDFSSSGAIVLASSEWHPGVIGIVASRIVDEFYRPTALISVRNGVGKASARSIPGFDLYQGLAECSDLLLRFGGHKYAAGFSISEDAIPRFRERFSSLVMRHMGSEGFIRTLSVDGSVVLDELTADLLGRIEQMGPFGPGNPEPRLGARGIEVLSSRIVGEKHLKLLLRQRGGRTFGAIAFNCGDRLEKIARTGATIAAVFTPRINTWNNSFSIELEIRDIKPDNAPVQ